ncbi:cadherin-like domain-containing protein [Kistimonas asteriae]|uniref:cadherin-like domain-containing protein n=1 Tax=Kistimonas asteriae TaxID=517724 RepID=UPI001BAB936B|nr:cadherin-like domain-containing protein [Kistimonas asteriae]
MAVRFLLQALEPRVLLDAAGLATLADTSPAPVEHTDFISTDTDYRDAADRLLRNVAETTVPAISDAGASSRRMQEDSATPLAIDGISVSHPIAEETLSLTIRMADNNPRVDPGSLDRILILGDSTDVTVTPSVDGLTLAGTSVALNHALTGMTILPTGHFNGTITLTFQVTDDSGDSCDPLAVAIVVRPVNDPVTISDDIHLSAQEGGAVTFVADQFGLRDPDIDTGDQLLQQMTVRIDSLPLEGQLTFKGNRMVAGTTFSYDQLDKLVYTHNGQDVQAGETDRFRVTVFDGAGTSDNGEVIIDLQPKNQPPAISVGDNTLFEGQGKRLALSLQDPEISHADTPEKVQINVTGLSAGLVSEGRLFLDNDGDGVFGAGDTELTIGSVFTADQLDKVAYEHHGGETGSNGDLSFTLAVTDAGGGTGDAGKLTASETIVLDILPVDDDPVLVTNNPITVTPCSSTRIDRDHLRSDDIDNRPSELVYTLESSPVYGLVVVNIGGTPKEVSVGARFTQKQIDEGQVRYLQTVSVSGNVTDTFMFSVRDSTLKAWPNPGEEGGVRYGKGQPIATDNRFTIHIPEPSTKPCEGLLPEDGLEELKPTFPVNNNEGAPKPVMTIEGGEALITNVNLDYSMISKDGTEETPPSEVIFTVTRLPPNGQLQVYDGVQWDDVGTRLIGDHHCGDERNDIKSYGYFTQQNINSNCVRFVHDGSEDHVSSFEFSVGDGGPNRVYGILGLGAIPVNDRPVARGGELTVIEKAGTQTGIAAITDKQIMATDVDGSEDYPVITDVRGQPVAVRQGGLLAEVYDTGAALSKVADIDTLTHQEPDSFFTATTFSYTDHGRHTLSDFLGVEDSHTLFGNPDAHLHTMAFRFTGYIDLKAGDHHFSVGSDDGFVLRVGGRDISQYDGNRPYSRDNKGSGDFHADREGLYPVELIYWENGGKATLDVELDGQSINPDTLFKPRAAAEPQGKETYQQLTDVDGRSVSVSQGGLLGEVFDTGGSLLGDWIETLASLNSIASAERLMSEPPDSVFKASSFHYTDQGRHSLQDFLGTTDAQSLRGGNKQAALTTMAFHFRGYIDLTAGEHHFTIGSDDGFRLNVDGQTVSQYDGNRAYAKSQGAFTAAKAGLYPIDLVYWENGGDARLTVEMDGKALEADRLHALPFPLEPQSQNTDSVGYIEGLPDDLWFKIRSLPQQGVLEYWDGGEPPESVERMFLCSITSSDVRLLRHGSGWGFSHGEHAQAASAGATAGPGAVTR